MFSFSFLEYLNKEVADKVENAELFKTPVGKSYKCDKESEVDVKSVEEKTKLYFKDLQIQAFNEEDEVKFGDGKLF